MGNRHTRSQRKRWAHLTRTVPIDEVAARAGVKRGTVRSWRTEFGVTGGDVAVRSAAGRVRPDRGPTATAADVQPTGAPAGADGCDMGPGVRQATLRYVEQHREWFHDAEGRQSDKKEMREVISDWEGQHGPLTPREKAEARTVLGQ